MQLIYTNSMGVSITLTYSRPFFIEKIDGTGAVKNNLHTQKSPFQDGVTLLSKDLDIRQITLEGTILAYSKLEIMNYRKQMVQAFNPKLSGKLTYIYEGGQKVIPCEIDMAPVFKDISLVSEKFLISLICNDPYWKDITQIKVDIAQWIGDFSFPLQLLSTGTTIGHKSPSLIVDVFNGGDVSCAALVQFIASGPVTNPSILNVNTGEYIKVNRVMQAGEVITITTSFANKKITSNIGGVVTNIFNLIDLNSTFLQLNVGDNLFRYNSDLNINNLSVAVYYTPQYLGV